MDSLFIKTKNTSLYACLLMLCFLILARDIYGMGIPNISFAVIVAVAALILRLEKFKIFLFFLFPFTCGIPGYTMMVSIIALFIKSENKKVRIRNLQIVPTLFIALLEFLNCVIHTGNIDISAYASFISFTAVFFFLLFDKSNYIQSRECLVAFIGGTVFVAVVIYYKMIAEFGLDMILIGNLRGVMGDVAEEGTGKLITNGNNMAYLSIITVSCLLLGAKKLKMPLFLYYPIIVFSILFGMGTFSRTWLLVCGLLIVVYLLHKKDFRTLFSLMFVFSVIILLFPSILDGFMNVMTGRMTGENIETAGGRTVIFNQYNKLWSQSILYILFGVSVTSYNSVLHLNFAMHNSIQQIYVCTGMVGLLLYFFLIVSLFKQKYKGNKSILNYLPFLAGSMFLLSIQFLRPYFLMLPIIPACYAYFIREEN